MSGRIAAESRAVLLDVNILLALFDPMHQQHRLIRDWYDDNDRTVATCALTELGFVRIGCHPSYPNPMERPEQAIDLLSALHRSGRHRFFAQSPSPTEAGFSIRPFKSHRDTTDRYLLRLAIHHDSQLLTLDAGIRPADAQERDALLLLKP